MAQSMQDSKFSKFGVIATYKDVSVERFPIQEFLQQTWKVSKNNLSGFQVGLKSLIPREPEPKIVTPITVGNFSDRVVGSCDGLICSVTKENDCRLWNPFIGESKLLCSMDLNYDVDEPNNNYKVIGFGYDKSTDDFKVVASSLLFDNKNNRFNSMVKVFSLKRNFWKRISDFQGGVLDCDSSQFAYGKIYWFTQPSYDLDPHSRRKRNIVSLDLEKEVFEIVDQPNYSDNNHSMVMTALSVLDGSISVFFRDNLQPHADLWVRDEINRRWTILVTISTPALMQYPNLRPCFLLPNLKILFVIDKDFLEYDPYNDSFMLTSIIPSRSRIKVQPVIHVESLVSPIAYPNNEKFNRRDGGRKGMA